MIDTHPKTCNLCGEKVEYTKNSRIYGKPYGSGYCYHCTACGAYVGTHRTKPDEAMGILANKEMREWKMKCHELFDPFWKNEEKGRHQRRNQLYIRLAGEMGLPVSDCHFGYFELEELKRAYKIVETWKEIPPENMPYEAATEPCLSCFLAEWTDMYGMMAYVCDMSHCIMAEEPF